MSLIDPAFVYRNLEVQTSGDVFSRIGRDLLDADMVEDDYIEALGAREAQFPTGLPISGGVAIPHTDASHVRTDRICVATLGHPVEFHEMGGDEDSIVEVSTVFLLALSDPSRHLKILQKIVTSIQNEQFLESIRAAATACEIASLAATEFDDELVKQH